MKKTLALGLALIMVISLLAGMGISANADDTYTLKMHLSVGPTDPVYASAEIFKQAVEERTKGNITVELYPSSQLGNTADCLEGLSFRACDIVYDSMANICSMSELANIDATPYMYSSVDHFRAVWEGEVGAEILQTVGDDANLVLMGGGLQGVRVLTTNKPVYGVEDIKGMKIRVPTIDIYLETWKWLGASPTPLGASEIFTALQQGTVDGQENPYASCASLSLYEAVKYVTETNHVYSVDTFAMDKGFFESLPEEYQQIIRDAAAEATVACTDLILDMTAEKKQLFLDAGCEILDTDITEWQAALDGFLPEKFPSLVPLYEMILAADPAAEAAA